MDMYSKLLKCQTLPSYSMDQFHPVDLLRVPLLGAVSVHLPDTLLEEVMTHLLAQLSPRTLKADLVRTYVQALGQVR